MIDTIAFIHQHQRKIKTYPRGEQVMEYIEVTLADIALANKIAHDVLGRSLDELPPQTRRLLKLIDGYVSAQCTAQKTKRADCRFSRRALREAIVWGDTQLKIHLARLAELEYLVAHRTRNGGFEYELMYDLTDADNTLRFPGLADMDALKCAYDVARSGQNDSWSASGRGAVGGQSGGSRADQSPEKAIATTVADDICDPEPKPHLLRPNGKIASYPQPTPLAAVG